MTLVNCYFNKAQTSSFECQAFRTYFRFSSLEKVVRVYNRKEYERLRTALYLHLSSIEVILLDIKYV